MVAVKLIDRFNDWLIAKGIVPVRLYYAVVSIIIFLSLLALAMIFMSTMILIVAGINYFLASKTISRLPNNDDGSEQ